MTNRFNTSPYVGERWIGTDHRVFTIVQIYTQGTDPWVEYSLGPVTFTCRLAAFKERFTPVAD